MPTCFPTDTAALPTCTARSPASARCWRVCSRTRVTMRMCECACERPRARVRVLVCFLACMCLRSMCAFSVRPMPCQRPALAQRRQPAHWRVSASSCRAAHSVHPNATSFGGAVPTMAGPAGCMLANTRPACGTATSSRPQPAALQRSSGCAPRYICTATGAHPCYTCAGTWLARATSAKELGSPLHRDWQQATGLRSGCRSAFEGQRARVGFPIEHGTAPFWGTRQVLSTGTQGLLTHGILERRLTGTRGIL
jgi:hypothetical protein